MSSGASNWGAAVASPVYAVSGLEFAYGPLQVLRGLSLSILPGRFYGIVGPNGCGKTTLLDLMAGSRRPRAGRLLFQGKDLETYAGNQLARHVAMVPQEFVTNFPFTVLETVLMGRHPHIPRFAAPTATDLALVEKAMEQMELGDLREKLVTELSGGEKQRVVLARALAQDTPTLLMDEPTSNLDVNHSLAALGVMDGLVRQEGRTVVAVMHDLNLAAAFCDHLIFMRDGRIHGAGPTGEVLDSRNLREVFGVRARVKWDDFAGSRVVVFKKDGGRS
jgi:iron complex transport system ATP-binding protein